MHKYAVGVTVTRAGQKRIDKRLISAQRTFTNRFAVPKPVVVTTRHLTASKARILGHILFDGFASQYLISYSTASKLLAQQFHRDLTANYRGIKARIRVYPSTNIDVYEVSDASVIACSDIRRFVENNDHRTSQVLANYVLGAGSRVIGEILRAFWEDEGSVTVGGNIIGSIKNRELRGQLLVLHKRMGIDVSSFVDRVNGMFGVYVRRSRPNLLHFDLTAVFRKSIVTQGHRTGSTKRSFFLEYLSQR